MKNNFKPMLVQFDEQGYKSAEAEAINKLKVLDEAKVWCEKYIDVKNLKEFEANFLKYFKDNFYSKNKELIKLDIKVEKIMELMDVPFEELKKLQLKYQNNGIDVTFINGEATTKIDKEQYQLWTVNDEENEKLLAGKKFINACENLKEYTHVYANMIQQATSNFIQFDMRKNKYNVSIQAR